MKKLQLFAASAVLLGALAASQTAQAHASFTIGTAAATPDWLNGVPSLGVEYPNPATPGININSTAFTGVHGATASNNRIIETGVYNTAASDAQLGGSFNGVATSYKNTLLGQLANNNASATATHYAYNGGLLSSQAGSLGLNEAVAVTQGSALTPFYDSTHNTFNQGDLVINPYLGSGSTASSPNGELNIINNTNAQYANFAIAADNYAVTGNYNTGVNAGSNQLEYWLYQGVATGPGLQGLVLLGNATATAPGQELDFSVKLQGAYLGNNPINGGQFTLVVGDVSQSANAAAANYVNTFDQYIKIAEWETGAGSANTLAGLQTITSTVYQEQGTVPTPLPGMAWLFLSSFLGFLGLARRKQALV